MSVRNVSFHALLWVVSTICLCLFAAAEHLDAQTKTVQPRAYFVTNVDSTLRPDSESVANIVRGSKRSWKDGSTLTMILPGREHPFFERMQRSFFAGRGSTMQRHWLRLVFSGRANPAEYAKSVEDMCRSVRYLRGSAAIFYDAIPANCQSLVHTVLPLK